MNLAGRREVFQFTLQLTAHIGELLRNVVEFLTYAIAISLCLADPA